MLALSIKEPWLTLIVDGINGVHKSIETRTWKTDHVGALLLVGSKKPKGIYAGKMACVVTLLACRPMQKADKKEAMCDYHPSLFAWVLQKIQPVVPVHITGRLGLYEVMDYLIEWKCVPPIIIERG